MSVTSTTTDGAKVLWFLPTDVSISGTTTKER